MESPSQWPPVGYTPIPRAAIGTQETEIPLAYKMTPAGNAVVVIHTSRPNLILIPGSVLNALREYITTHPNAHKASDIIPLAAILFWRARNTYVRRDNKNKFASPYPLEGVPPTTTSAEPLTGEIAQGERLIAVSPLTISIALYLVGKATIANSVRIGLRQAGWRDVRMVTLGNWLNGIVRMGLWEPRAAMGPSNGVPANAAPNNP